MMNIQMMFYRYFGDNAYEYREPKYRTGEHRQFR